MISVAILVCKELRRFSGCETFSVNTESVWQTWVVGHSHYIGLAKKFVQRRYGKTPINFLAKSISMRVPRGLRTCHRNLCAMLHSLTFFPLS